MASDTADNAGAPRSRTSALENRGALPLVRFESITKRFGDVAAVDNVSLDIRAREFFALLGPSGCGKTTLLRMLAGFERPDTGRILLDGEDIAAVPPHRRPVNMMFQNYALFPHLSVEGNVAFGLKQEGLARSEIGARVADILALVRLEGFGRRRPHELSGGQRQRVALARALVKRPKVFLLDEPLAALDRKLREETRFELAELQHRLGVTFVIVTHDQEEAMTMADRMAVMNHGRIVQLGTPTEIYEQPGSRWVAEFIGDVNVVEGKFLQAGEGMAVIETLAGGRLCIAQPSAHLKVGDAVAVAVRPEKVRIEPAQTAAPGENRLAGKVLEIGYLGDTSIYKVRADNGLLFKAAVPNVTRVLARPISWDDRVVLSFAPDAGVVLAE